MHNLQHVAEKGSLVNFFISGAGAFGSKAELEAARLEALGTLMGSSHTPRGLRHPEGRAWSSANWVEDGPGFLSIGRGTWPRPSSSTTMVIYTSMLLFKSMLCNARWYNVFHCNVFPRGNALDLAAAPPPLTKRIYDVTQPITCITS